MNQSRTAKRHGVQEELFEYGPGEHASTRDRILDIALDLFSTQGYDGTSVREIADKLGLSKASIYYHFPGKEDILMELHFRLHEFGREAMEAVDRSETSPDIWMALLDRLIDQILDYHDLFILQEHNKAVIEQLHRERHISEHDLIDEWFRTALLNQEIPLDGRVRMACAFRAVMGILDLVGDVFAEVPSVELAEQLRKVVNSLMAPSVGSEA